jgi:hypothetical protein
MYKVCDIFTIPGQIIAMAEINGDSCEISCASNNQGLLLLPHCLFTDGKEGSIDWKQKWGCESKKKPMSCSVLEVHEVKKAHSQLLMESWEGFDFR